MNIILDCYGGDNCPFEAVKGAVTAVQEREDLTVTLIGKTEEIKAIVSDLGYNGDRLEYLNADEVITNDDQPTLAIRRKKNSSMVIGLRALAEDEKYEGMVSSGNTGALLVGGTLIVKLVDNVTRAALSPLFPSVSGANTLIVDGGANVDCKPQMLQEFAVMGDVYMREVMGIETPKVALLSNGAEEEKGNALTKEAHQLLKTSGINFVGNIEAKNFVDGVVDVIVSDGFAANMCIKTVEGTGKALFTLIKKGITEGGLRAKLGYLLLKPVLRKVKNAMSSDEIGGAVFLGLKKPVIKAHGSSVAQAFANAIYKAMIMAENKVAEKIAVGLVKMKA